MAGSPNPFFTDLFFAMLAFNTSIKKLEMNFKSIPQSSFTQLKDALTSNTVLEDLTLKNCTMTNTYIDMIVHGLGMNPKKMLRSLCLHDIKMNDSCLISLFSYLQNMNPPCFKELTLSHLNLLSETFKISQMLQHNSHIEVFKLISCNVDASEIHLISEALAKHKEIKEI